MQESKHIIYLDANNLYDYVMSKFLRTSGFKWIDPKVLGLNKYTINSSKGCVVEVDLQYPKVLQELQMIILQLQIKKEIKRKMLSDYQLKIADHYNIPMLKNQHLIFLIKKNT